MLVPREELRFDFKGAVFDLGRLPERQLLAWVFNQFLYGEVTGIQCGHWLYEAPHLNAATFIARQATEELSHVRKILRVLTLLGEAPAAAHPAVRFLSTGMMGGSWGEHVAIEMALGEGLVLGVFYAMVDTIPEPEIHRILDMATSEEERHCEFGEKETVDWLRAHPRTRSLLLGLALVQVIALRWLRGFVLGKLLRGDLKDHPVLRQFPEFYEHGVRAMETRIHRMGLSQVPLEQLGLFTKLQLIVGIPFRKLLVRLTLRRRRLTATYLDDPVLRAEQARKSS